MRVIDYLFNKPLQNGLLHIKFKLIQKSVENLQKSTKYDKSPRRDPTLIDKRWILNCDNFQIFI